MENAEILRRLERLSKHAVHTCGEPPFCMSLDDGIALESAIALLKEQEIGHWISLENCSNSGVYCSECHTKIF